MLAKIFAALVAFGPLGVFLLGFIDSAGVPIAMGTDALIVLVGIEAPERAYLTAFLALLGSLGGNLVLFELSRRGGRRFLERGAAAPGKRQRFRDWFDRYGLVTVFVPAVIPFPLPLKVFVISAGVLRTRLSHFFLVMLAARIPRYFGLAWLAIRLGEDARGFIARNLWNLGGASALLALALFLLIRLSDARRRAAANPS